MLYKNIVWSKDRSATNIGLIVYINNFLKNKKLSLELIAAVQLFAWHCLTKSMSSNLALQNTSTNDT